ncbi:MAG: glycine cleavage system protein GcvH [Candidatus Omnitrophota bacterium]
MEVPQYFLYTKEHEWINIDGKTATIGITDYAQDALGDITFVEPPSIGTEVDQFEQITTLESVKAANDIFCPMAGKIIEVNTDLEQNPELINQSCYEKGWIAKIEISDPSEKSNLMNAGDYEHFLEGLED